MPLLLHPGHCIDRSARPIRENPPHRDHRANPRLGKCRNAQGSAGSSLPRAFPRPPATGEMPKRSAWNRDSPALASLRATNWLRSARGNWARSARGWLRSARAQWVRFARERWVRFAVDGSPFRDSCSGDLCLDFAQRLWHQFLTRLGSASGVPGFASPARKQHPGLRPRYASSARKQHPGPRPRYEHAAPASACIRARSAPRRRRPAGHDFSARWARSARAQWVRSARARWVRFAVDGSPFRDSCSGDLCLDFAQRLWHQFLTRLGSAWSAWFWLGCGCLSGAMFDPTWAA